MGRTRDFIDDHPVTGGLGDLAAELEQIATDEDRAGRVPEPLRDWSWKVHRYVIARLASLDPELVAAEQLDEAAGAVNQLTSHLSRLGGGTAGVDPATVEAGINHVLLHAARLPGPAVTDPTDAETRRLLDEVGAAVERGARTIAEQAAAVEEQLAALDAAVDERKATLAEELEAVGEAVKATRAEFEQERLADQQRRDAAETSFQAAEEDRKNRLTSVLEQFREEHQRAQSERTDEAVAALARIKEQAEALHQETERSSQATLGQLDKLHTQAEKTVGAIGRAGQTHGFAEWSSSERRAANWTRGAAGLAALAAAGTLIYILIERLDRLERIDGGVDVPVSLAFLSVTAAFAWLAGYLGRESTRHRQNSDLARRLELEIASLPTFIANLPEDVQEELTAIYTWSFFGHATRTGAGGEDVHGVLPMADFVERALEVVRESRQRRLGVADESA